MAEAIPLVALDATRTPVDGFGLVLATLRQVRSQRRPKAERAATQQSASRVARIVEQGSVTM